MFKPKLLQNNTGFTLIEILSVMVIMGVIASVGVKKFDILSETATINALQSGIRELRTRETVEWTKIKLSTTGYKNDAEVFDEVDKNIGRGYSWNPGPDPDKISIPIPIPIPIPIKISGFPSLVMT